MFKKIKGLFRRNGISIESYLKKLSINRQDLIEEISHFDQVVDSPVNAFITLAILLREKGEYYKSLKILERLMEEDLSDNEKKLVILNLAMVYKAAGFVDRAERILENGIKAYPTESFFYYELSQIMKSEGKLERAVELLEKAVEFKDSFRNDLTYTRLYLANEYVESGRTDRALRLLRKIDLSVPLQFHYYVLSKLFYSVGDLKKGYENALKGIRVNPKRSEPFIQTIEKHQKLSTEQLEKLAGESKFSTPVVKRLVKALISEGKIDRALTIVEELWKKRIFDPELFEIYIETLWNSGKRKKVAEEIISLLELLKEKKKLYRCEVCGFKTNHFDWVCPKCRSWESLEIDSEVQGTS